jgi:soluble lytic murein transglycosylase-like protein
MRSGKVPYMSRHPARLRWALRTVAAAAVVAAAVMVAGLKGREQPVKPPQQKAEAGSRPGNKWAFRVNGWFIQVDGVVPADPDQPRLAPPMAPAEAAAPNIAPHPISRFDRVIHRHAAEQGLDWRLVAALIFEESRFVPDRQSTAGAYGLMQIRPIAAADVGSERFKTPDDNIKTGIRYLKRLEKIFNRAHGRDRLALVLAAYNMGPGHVHDAQALARRFGYDPYCWDDSMDLMLPLLQAPTYFESLPNGYADGQETVTYVTRILNRYERYKAQTDEWPAFSKTTSDGQAASANG